MCVPGARLAVSGTGRLPCPASSSCKRPMLVVRTSEARADIVRLQTVGAMLVKCCLAHLRTAEDFAEGPHQRPVHAHELLLVHLVALIEHHPHLVIMSFQSTDDLTIGNAAVMVRQHKAEARAGRGCMNNISQAICHFQATRSGVQRASLNSSDMSSLCGSNSSKMRSHLAANQPAQAASLHHQ